MKKWLFYFFPYLTNELQREEWIRLQLMKVPAGESLIDVGAGEGRFKKYCGHLKYVSQDFGKYKGKGDKVGLQTGEWDTSEIDIISDINEIPVKNNSFDNVLCVMVLEHVPQPEMAVKEMARIVKKGGKLILQTPFCAQTHFAPYFFHTGFSIYWYKKILPIYNLKIIRIETYGNYFDYLGQELIRLPWVIRKYSGIGYLAMFFYVLLVPIVLIMWILSKLINNTEKQLCFGINVIAIKI